MFDQKQIVELKEAFSLIDHDTDGFIDREDLNDMLASLGQSPTEEYIEDMISEAPGSINFTMFLTLMGEKLSGTDPEHEILQAFECFDESGTGLCNAEELREWMTTMGDRFTDDEVSTLVYSLRGRASGMFFCSNLHIRQCVRKHAERRKGRKRCCDIHIWRCSHIGNKENESIQEQKRVNKSSIQNDICWRHLERTKDTTYQFLTHL